MIGGTQRYLPIEGSNPGFDSILVSDEDTHNCTSLYLPSNDRLFPAMLAFRCAISRATWLIALFRASECE